MKGDSNLMAEGKEELKSLLMKVKEESEKVGLKAQHLYACGECMLVCGRTNKIL